MTDRAQRIVIFGNSGSGKSTLAREKAAVFSCPHLDLDTVAWVQGIEPPTRKSLIDSENIIRPFLATSHDWVVEGCYSDLLALIIPFSTEIIFINPGVTTCILNCKNRPFEAHKYRSPEAQDADLDMLVEWIALYPIREDEFSLTAHRKLFDEYTGKKCEFTSNSRKD